MATLSMGLVLFSGVRAIDSSVANKMEDRKVKIEDKKTDKLCVRIDNVVSRLEKSLDSDRINLRERVESRIREMKESRDSRNIELEERRRVRDEARNKFYQDLEDKSSTDATKKVAISKFKNTVEVAVETRRTAIDNAKNAMNAGISQAMANRETNMESLRNEFEGNVGSAINKAKNACDSDVTSEELKTILSDLRDDVKNYRDTYKNKVSEEKKVQETIQKLREERKVAVKLAIENFKSTMKVAQEELRKAMSTEAQ